MQQGIDPAVIGRYHIQGVLGRGAMGVVYRAHDPEIDRQVAIKLIRADLLHGEERTDYLARFRHEAQAAGRCTHPNIVTIYDFATHEGNPFLAMEFVDGVSLAEARAPGRPIALPMTVQDACDIILQVLDALGAAHALGVVHRDIKPANILLMAGGRVKVTDFGISRIVSSELTQDGAAIGTPSYMSPEQCRAEPVDGRSDLFSAAVLLYELLCGARAFAGNNFLEVTRAVIGQDLPPLAARGIVVPAFLQAALTRAVAKSAAARFATAADMAAAIRGPQPVSHDDRTVVQLRHADRPPIAPTDDGMRSGFAPEMLDTLERRLAQYVGPMARLYVQSASREAQDMQTLCNNLARQIADDAHREAFRRDFQQPAQTMLRRPSLDTSPSQAPVPAPAPAPAAGLDDAMLHQAQQALAPFIGPIAGILVKREAACVSDAASLWRNLASHIDKDADRRAFLASSPRL